MTENNRYFERMWEEEYYIFDSYLISEKEFEEKLEYQDYKAFEDSMPGDEVVNRLNELNNETQELRKFIMDLQNMIQFDVDNGIKTYPIKLSEYLANVLKEICHD